MRAGNALSHMAKAVADFVLSHSAITMQQAASLLYDGVVRSGANRGCARHWSSVSTPIKNPRAHKSWWARASRQRLSSSSWVAAS